MNPVVKEKRELVIGPGHCFFCLNGNSQHYIDTGRVDPGIGAVYVCLLCAEEMAKLLQGPTTEIDPMLASAIKDVQHGADKIQRMFDDFANDYLRYTGIIASGYGSYERALKESSNSRVKADKQQRDRIAELELELQGSRDKVSELTAELIAVQSNPGIAGPESGASEGTSSEELGTVSEPSSKSNDLGI